jgi:hypothetical protein
VEDTPRQGASPLSDDIFPAVPEGLADLPHREIIVRIVAIIDKWPAVTLLRLLEQIESADPEDGLDDDGEEDVKKLIKKNEMKIVRRLIAVATKPSTKQTNTTVRVAKDLLDRLYGKSPLAKDTMDTGEVPDTIILTDYRRVT